MKWTDDILADLLRRARLGDSWSAIALATKATSFACRGVWDHRRTPEDQAERQRAKSEIHSRQIVVAAVLRAEERALERQDIFSGSCFHDSPRALLNFGSVWMPPRPLNNERSLTGCAALMLVS